MNARPWWQLELAGASRLDVCTMAYRAGGFPPRVWFTGPNAAFSWDDPRPAIAEIIRFGAGS